MLLILGAVAVALLLIAVGWVVLREVNSTTEVEAAPGLSVAEATEFVISRLPDDSKRRMRRSQVERLVGYCTNLLESAGMALFWRRPRGDELGDSDLVIDRDGLARAMRDNTAVEAAEEDLRLVAEAFLEYLVAIGALGEDRDME